MAKTGYEIRTEVLVAAVQVADLIMRSKMEMHRIHGLPGGHKLDYTISADQIVSIAEKLYAFVENK